MEQGKVWVQLSAGSYSREAEIPLWHEVQPKCHWHSCKPCGTKEMCVHSGLWWLDHPPISQWNIHFLQLIFQKINALLFMASPQNYTCPLFYEMKKNLTINESRVKPILKKRKGKTSLSHCVEFPRWNVHYLILPQTLNESFNYPVWWINCLWLLYHPFILMLNWELFLFWLLFKHSFL